MELTLRGYPMRKIVTKILSTLIITTLLLGLVSCSKTDINMESIARESVASYFEDIKSGHVSRTVYASPNSEAEEILIALASTIEYEINSIELSDKSAICHVTYTHSDINSVYSKWDDGSIDTIIELIKNESSTTSNTIDLNVAQRAMTGNYDVTNPTDIGNYLVSLIENIDFTQLTVDEAIEFLSSMVEEAFFEVEPEEKYITEDNPFIISEELYEEEEYNFYKAVLACATYEISPVEISDEYITLELSISTPSTQKIFYEALDEEIMIHYIASDITLNYDLDDATTREVLIKSVDIASEVEEQRVVTGTYRIHKNISGTGYFFTHEVIEQEEIFNGKWMSLNWAICEYDTVGLVEPAIEYALETGIITEADAEYALTVYSNEEPFYTLFEGNVPEFEQNNN